MDRPFKGLYLHKTTAPFFFSFVTYTPQAKEQMIACGDLAEGEEYLSQVVCDFLLFISEGILGHVLTADFPISYDDVVIVVDGFVAPPPLAIFPNSPNRHHSPLHHSPRR